MRGQPYRETPESAPILENLTHWEELVINAVARVVGFWGFKQNYGRIWALLYLRGEPMTAAQLQESLDLSKGAVSMLTNSLEQQKIIHRIQTPPGRANKYSAESSFRQMLHRVFTEREMLLIEEVDAQLSDALRLAREEKNINPATLKRLKNMRRLADTARGGLKILLKLTEDLKA